MNETEEIIIGLYSVSEAVKNTNRRKYNLYATTQGEKNLKKTCSLEDSLEIHRRDEHSFQETAKRIYRRFGFDYRRISGGLLLLAEATPVFDTHWLQEETAKRKSIKIVCLDGITDVHNIGAILRSAAFYGVNALVFASRSSMTLGPGISKVSSGALEHVSLVRVASLSKMLRQLKQKGVEVLGLSEHAPSYCEASTISEKSALVLGSEEKGLSHAVVRNLSQKVSLKAQGPIKSLNVSVAAAVGMQIFLYE